MNRYLRKTSLRILLVHQFVWCSVRAETGSRYTSQIKNIGIDDTEMFNTLECQIWSTHGRIYQVRIIRVVQQAGTDVSAGLASSIFWVEKAMIEEGAAGSSEILVSTYQTTRFRVVSDRSHKSSECKYGRTGDSTSGQNSQSVLQCGQFFICGT
jgi:hypothetical protein